MNINYEEELQKLQQPPQEIDYEAELQSLSTPVAAAPATAASLSIDYDAELAQLPAAPKPAPLPVISRSTFEEQNVDLMGTGGDGTENQVQQERSYVTPAEVARDPERVQDVRKFFAARYPNLAAPKSDVALMKKFSELQAKSDMAYVEDITWALNANDEQKKAAFMVSDLAENITTPLTSEVGAILKSPSTYVGGVPGLVVKKVVGKTALSAIQRMAAVSVAAAVGEGTVAAGVNLLKQKGETLLSFEYTDDKGEVKTASVRDDISYAEAGLVAGVAAVLGGAGGAFLGKGVSAKEQMADLMVRKRDPNAANVAIESFKEQFASREKELYREPIFASEAERQAARASSLDVADAAQEATNSVLNKESIDLLHRTARQLFADNPELIPVDFDKKSIATVIAEVLEKESSDTIQQAASRAGISAQQFLDAFKVTGSEAATVLQANSSMAKFLNKIVDGSGAVDPDLEKLINRMVNAGRGKVHAPGAFGVGLRKVTDASVGGAVAGLSTLIANVGGLTATIGIRTAVDTINAGMRTFDGMVGAMRGDVPLKNFNVKEPVGQLINDGFRVMGHLLDNGYSQELFTAATKYNPRIKNLLLQASPEGERDSMNRFVTAINVMNRSVESFIRKPVFVASLRNRMDDLNLDFESFIANDKPIPAGLLELAAKDTLDVTFSSAFRKGGVGVEGGIEEGVAVVVNAVNSNNYFKTFANFTFPFFRFALSSIKYSYQLTPASAVIGGRTLLKEAASLESLAAKTTKKSEAAGLRAEASGLRYQAKQKIITSSIGLGLIGYASGVRRDNADLPMTQVRSKSGEVYDTAPYAPYSNLLAIGETVNHLQDMGKGLWYTFAMTLEERKAEAAKFRQQANSLARNEEGRQAFIDKAELLEYFNLRDFDQGTFSQVILGMGRTAGTQKSLVDSVTEVMESGVDSKEGLDMMRGAGRYAGDFLSRFDNVLNPVYDVINAMRGDLRSVDSKDAPALGAGAFVDEMVNSLSSPVPIARDRLRDRPSLFDEGTQQVPTATRYVSGVKANAPTTDIENELLRLGVEPYKVLPRDKDRSVRNKIIVIAQPIVTANARELLNDPDYQRLSMDEQRKGMEDVIRKASNEAKKDVEDNLTEEEQTNRQYERLPKRTKDAAEDNFIRVTGRSPTTLEDKQDILNKDFADVDDITDFARGGLATQTKKAFSR
jgi:hypothetical protein